MREFYLSDGSKVRITAHFDLRYQRRKVALEEIKETIENPDSVTDDKKDADGKKYWKSAPGHSISKVPRTFRERGTVLMNFPLMKRERFRWRGRISHTPMRTVAILPIPSITRRAGAFSQQKRRKKMKQKDTIYNLKLSKELRKIIVEIMQKRPQHVTMAQAIRAAIVAYRGL